MSTLISRHVSYVMFNLVGIRLITSVFFEITLYSLIKLAIWYLLTISKTVPIRKIKSYYNATNLVVILRQN